MKRPALALVASAFLAVALAQTTVPSTPPAPAPVTDPTSIPAPEVPLPDIQPLPEPPLQPLPAPVPVTPVQPAPEPIYPPIEIQPNTVHPQPAPLVPTPGVSRPALPSSAGLTLVLDVPLKLLQDGQPVAGSNRQTLVLSAERTASLRRGGVITASLDADLRAFAKKVTTKPQDARFEQFASGWALVQRDGVNIDLDAVGNIVGIDIDHASTKLDLATLEMTALPFRDLKAA